MGSFFDVGGMTPEGPKDQAVGIVHASEWVAPKWMRESPTWGPVINRLEGVRRRGYADGGYVDLDPTGGLTMPTETRGRSADSSQSSDTGSSSHVTVNTVVVDSDTAARRYATSRRGRSAIISADRQRRTERRLRS